ncbi:hypothetical protein BGZ47_005084 [Haplosporangium gracile]|nr:hypothetical protein BGZ47_005084 [Haplosporangium gracile]
MAQQHDRHTPLPSQSSPPIYSDYPTDTDSGREETSSSTSTKTKAKTNGASKKHFTQDHFDFMVDWLERPENCARVFSASGKTTIGGKETKSANVAIEELAKHVSKAGSFILTGANLRARFTRHLGEYKEIKRNKKATGYGLTEEDYNNKIRTLAQKYEKECHSFECMDKIFGTKPNVSALASMEGGLSTMLKIQGTLVDIGLFDNGNRDGDDGSVVGQVEDDIFPIEENRTTLPVQHGIFTIEDDPLEAEERTENEVAAPIGPAKRSTDAPTESTRAKRPKASSERVPPLKLNKQVEKDRLQWDKEKWLMERDLRLEERKTEMESKRPTTIAALA